MIILRATNSDLEIPSKTSFKVQVKLQEFILNFLVIALKNTVKILPGTISEMSLETSKLGLYPVIHLHSEVTPEFSLKIPSGTPP